MTARQTIDQAKLDAFLGKVVGDLGAAASAALVVIGDKLGLYRELAKAPATPAELGKRTGTVERYVREWLVNQAASGFVEYDRRTGRYVLAPEHAIALTDENSPAFVVGGFQVITGMLRAAPRIQQAFKSGAGMTWGEHDPELFEGTERFFRPNYVGNLLSSWIPALDGVGDRLKSGAKVADVGCGHGASTISMAGAFPKSKFYGFDSHGPSIETAKEHAEAAGVAATTRFDISSATGYQGNAFDLICFFDCLHDMGDPVGAASHAYDALAANGTVMLVEPSAGQKTEDNFNPVGRIFAAASVLVCTPNAIATGGNALGTLATDKQLSDVFKAAGFTKFRRAAETPFNRVFEAKR